MTGRLKDMIIRGGENIYPREVEAILVQHPAVLTATVLGIPDERWGGESVAAVVTLDDDRTVTGTELHDFVRAHLAPHKAPEGLVSRRSAARQRHGQTAEVQDP